MRVFIGVYRDPLNTQNYLIEEGIQCLRRQATPSREDLSLVGFGSTLTSAFLHLALPWHSSTVDLTASTENPIYVEIL